LFSRRPKTVPQPSASAAGASATAPPILGIDLGTTHTVAAVVWGGAAQVIPNRQGNRLTPSVVARTPAGDWLRRDSALRQASLQPQRTVFGVKRLLGRRRDDLPDGYDTGAALASGLGGFVRVEIDGEYFTPQELAAWLLRTLREAAEAHLQCPVRHA